MSIIRIFIVTTLISFFSTPSFAQTLFKLQDTTPNYLGYKYIEECASAARRIGQKHLDLDPRWIDTTQRDIQQELLSPYPDQAIAAGRLCMSNKNMDTISVELSREVANVLLVLGLDGMVDHLYQRLLEAQSPDKRAKLMVEWMYSYGSARPVRFESMMSVYERIKLEAWADTANILMLEVSAVMAGTAFAVGDTQYAMTLGKEVVEQNEKLSVDQRNVDGDGVVGAMRNFKRTMYIKDSVYSRLFRKSFLDSLSVGPDARRAWFVQLVSRVFGDTTWMDNHVVEGPFPRLSGDFMFRGTGDIGSNGLASYASVPKEEWKSVPEKGKVNLLVNLRNGICNQYRNSFPPPGNIWTQRDNNNWSPACIETLSALRRLKERNPEIVLTLVTRTYGTVGYSAPLTPEQEADTLAKFYLGLLRMPANLVIETTPWIRMPGNPLDDRRVDQQTPNQDSLERNRFGSGNDLIVHCVDQDGNLFCREPNMVRRVARELTLEDELAAVVKRKRTAVGAAPKGSD